MFRLELVFFSSNEKLIFQISVHQITYKTVNYLMNFQDGKT